MAQIVIEFGDVNDAADACRYVANLIDDGYTNGIIGCSGDSWYIEE